MLGQSKFLPIRQWSLKNYKKEGFDYPYAYKVTEASKQYPVEILSADSNTNNNLSYPRRSPLIHAECQLQQYQTCPSLSMPALHSS